MKTKILKMLSALVAMTASSLVASPPTIVWRVCDSNGVVHLEGGPAHSDLPVRFPEAGQWIQVRASGHSDTGHLMNVVVWKDGVPLAYDDGGWENPEAGKGYWNNTDPNWAYVGSAVGELHVFKAQAFSYDEGPSPAIYWITKNKAPGSPDSPTLTYADLVTIASVNPNGTVNPWLPNTGDFITNTFSFDEVILSLKDSLTTGKVLEFTPDEYKFDLRKTGWEHGYMDTFQNVRNLTLLGKPGTVFNWAIRDYETGLPIDPVYFSHRFIATPGHPENPRPAYSDETASPSDPLRYVNNDQPHHFLDFDTQCSGITIQGIRFTTDYSTRIGHDGSHIKIHGTHHRITECTFEKCPGFAINAGVDSYFNVDANLFQNTYADGLHVDVLPGGGSVWLVGNVFYNTLDDSISGGGHDIHIWWNTIIASHWRGILMWSGSSMLDIRNNHIVGTGSYGIHVGQDYMSPDSNSTEVPWCNDVQIYGNYFEQIGTTLRHQNILEGYGPEVAMRLDRIHDLYIDAQPDPAISSGPTAVNNAGSSNNWNRTVNLTNINSTTPGYSHGLKNGGYLYVNTNGVDITTNQIGGADEQGDRGGLDPQGVAIADLPGLPGNATPTHVY